MSCHLIILPAADLATGPAWAKHEAPRFMGGKRVMMLGRMSAMAIGTALFSIHADAQPVVPAAAVLRAEAFRPDRKSVV